MSEPDYILCLDCENPVYVFEWRNDKLHEALCTVCGNEDLDQFATEKQIEEMDEAIRPHSG
jgi:hypothetical protein